MHTIHNKLPLALGRRLRLSQRTVQQGARSTAWECPVRQVLVAAAATALSGAVLALRLEGTAAAAAGNSVRIINAEAAAHQAIYKVNGSAAYIHQAGWVNHKAHAIHFNLCVILLRAALKRHAILQA